MLLENFRELDNIQYIASFDYQVIYVGDEETLINMELEYCYEKINQIGSLFPLIDLKNKEDWNKLANSMLSKGSNYTIKDFEQLIVHDNLWLRIKFLAGRLSRLGYRHEYRDDCLFITEKTSNQDEEEAINEINIPYKIALLHEMGFFNLPVIKRLTKVKLYQLLKKLIGGDERTIRGNINVLNEVTNESALKYTSHRYLEDAKKQLE